MYLMNWSILTKRKQILMNRLKKIFVKRAQDETNYSNLKSSEKEILKIKQQFDKRSQINSDNDRSIFTCK